MRTVEVLQVLATFVGAALTAVASLQRTLLTRLEAKEANSPDKAVALPGLKAFSRWCLERLRRHGVVHRTPEGLTYYDEDALRLFRKRRRGLATGVVLVAAVVVLVLFVAHR